MLTYSGSGRAVGRVRAPAWVVAEPTSLGCPEAPWRWCAVAAACSASRPERRASGGRGAADHRPRARGRAVQRHPRRPGNRPLRDRARLRGRAAPDPGDERLAGRPDGVGAAYDQQRAGRKRWRAGRSRAHGRRPPRLGAGRARPQRQRQRGGGPARGGRGTRAAQHRRAPTAGVLAAEELGSTGRAATYSPASERRRIEAYVNLDMVGSPNALPEE